MRGASRAVKWMNLEQRVNSRFVCVTAETPPDVILIADFIGKLMMGKCSVWPFGYTIVAKVVY
jgi:hypothetical protein